MKTMVFSNRYWLMTRASSSTQRDAGSVIGDAWRRSFDGLLKVDHVIGCGLCTIRRDFGRISLRTTLRES